MAAPSTETLKRLMSDSTRFCEDYRTANIDAAHQRADRAYHGILENEADYEARGRSKIFVPKTRDHCRRWKTTLINAFVMSDDVVTLAYPPSLDKERFTNEVFNMRLEDGGEFYGFITAAADAHVKYGQAVGKVGWAFDREEKISEESDPETGEPVQVRDVEVFEDRLFFDNVPFEDVAYDYRVIGNDPVNQSPFFRHWTQMYRSEVEAKFESGEWIRPEKSVDWSSVSRRGVPLAVKGERHGKMEDPSEKSFDGGQEEPISSYDMVWVSESYFRIGREDWTFMTLGDEYIVTKPVMTRQKFPFDKRPFRISKFDPEAFRSYSDGLPEMMKGLQAETNAIRNQRRDNVSLALAPPTMVRRGAGIQLPSLRSRRPGAIVLGDMITANDIREHVIQDVTASSYREEDIANRDIEEISAQSGNRLGVTVADRTSATEAAIKASASGEMEGFAVKSFVETFVRPILEMGLAFVVAFETDEDVLQQAADATGLPPDVNLLVKCEVTVNAGMGTINKELRSMRLAQVTDRLIQLMPVMGPKLETAVEETLKEWLPLMGLKNMTRFFPQQQPQGPGLPPGTLATGGGNQPSPPGTPPPGASPGPALPPEGPEVAPNAPVEPSAFGKNLGGFARGLMQ